MSPFTFKVIFSFSRLPANQMFQLWTFYPDGEAIAGTGFSSDNKGNAMNRQGINEIHSSESSSNILPNGEYIFGINIGNFQFTKKPYFDDWQNSPNSKCSRRINLTSEKITILRLNEIGNVPWGTDTIVSGHLWFKDVDIQKEPQIMPNGAGWL
jgi:hypothetical protein